MRKNNAPTNIAIIRHAALNMMRTAKKANITHKRRSIRLMRKSTVVGEKMFWLDFFNEIANIEPEGLVVWENWIPLTIPRLATAVKAVCTAVLTWLM